MWGRAIDQDDETVTVVLIDSSHCLMARNSDVDTAMPLIALAIGKWLEVIGGSHLRHNRLENLRQRPNGNSNRPSCRVERQTSTAEDFRFTPKDGVLYAIMLD
jgi:hypothetical protein